MTNTEIQSESDHEWKVQGLRLTSFLVASPSEKNFGDRFVQWWKNVADEEPETIQSQPRQHSFQAIGSFGSGQLQLFVQQLRVDWVFSPASRLPVDNQPPYFLESYDDLVAVFRKVIEAWFETETMLQLQRMAFGAVLVQLASSREDALHRLAPFLKKSVIIDTNTMHDLVYQVNRRRQSNNIEKLDINCLSKWSAIMGQAIMMTFGQAISTNIELTQPRWVTQLELDINTVAEFSDLLPTELWVDISNELIAYGSEIVTRGDI